MNSSHFIIAPVWRRIAALIYDSLIMLAISFVYSAAITLIAVKLGRTPEQYQPMFHTPLFLVGWIVCLMAFYCWFWHKSGQTLGMRTWRLKLIQQSATQQLPTWSQCFLRTLISPPSILFFGFGYCYQLLDKDKNCLHDKLSNTRVIIVNKDN